MEIPGRKPSSRHATAMSGQADLGKHAWWCVIKKKKKKDAPGPAHIVSASSEPFQDVSGSLVWTGGRRFGGGDRDVLSDWDPATARKSACRGLFLPSMPLLQIARAHN